jgi:glutamate--cysteine ligase
MADARGSQPIVTFDDLLGIFFDAETSGERIGPEMEKFGLVRATLAPITYEGRESVLTIFDALEAAHGWQREGETPGGPALMLRGSLGTVTLEPGCQLELSGSASDTVHLVDHELREHVAQLGPISHELGLTWLGLGFHPLARREDLAWVPKKRYPIMRSYLPSRGAHALDMMLRTSTVQANFDFVNELDAMRKMRISMALSPLVTAMFANSPWKEGKRHEGLSYRARVWLDVDPDRGGLVPNLWKADSSYADYVEWALDVPMFLIKRGGETIDNTGQTFRAFWKEGRDGHRATFADWEGHLNTLFPEVRLKKTIEVRGADSQRLDLASALVALWTGIFYDARSLSAAEALVDGWTFAECQAVRERLWRDGLRTPFRETTFVELAEKVVAIARDGLVSRARQNEHGLDESAYLKPIEGLVARGLTPAEELLALQGERSLEDFLRTSPPGLIA